MRFVTKVLAGTVLATASLGIAAPAFAAAPSAPAQVVQDSDEFFGVANDPVVIAAEQGIPTGVAEAAFGR
jgi:hypothetical protein